VLERWHGPRGQDLTNSVVEALEPSTSEQEWLTALLGPRLDAAAAPAAAQLLPLQYRPDLLRAQSRAQLQELVQRREKLVQRLPKTLSAKDKRALHSIERSIQQHKSAPPGTLRVGNTGDGACLFKAIAAHLTGDAEHHSTVRQLVVRQQLPRLEAELLRFLHSGGQTDTQLYTILTTYADDYTDNVPDGSVPAYLARMATETAWGGNAELQAASLLFELPIALYDERDDMQGFVLNTQYNSLHSAGLQPMPFLLLRKHHHYCLFARRRHW
jgi:OTU-like cysteine protease